ncbi:MAG: hypothetical protein RL660_2011 [Bacteroidota bacterium]|jgi:hypothetical protein
MMRFTRLILALLSILLAGSVAHAQLIQTNGPYDGGINDMALGSNNRIWIATNLGLYYSDDTLQTTTKCPGVDEWPFRSLAVNGDSIIALVSHFYGITQADSIHYYRSIDNGLTWSHLKLPASVQTGSGIDEMNHRPFEFQSASTLRLYIEQICRAVTKDFGLTWQKAPLSDSLNAKAYDVTIAGKSILQNEPVFPQGLVSLFYSNDEGNSWMVIDTNANTSPYLYIGALDSNLYYAIKNNDTDCYVYRKNLATGLVDTAIILPPKRIITRRWLANHNGILLQADSLYFTNQGTLLSHRIWYRSIDGGLNWTVLSENHPFIRIRTYSELPNSALGFFCSGPDYAAKIYNSLDDSSYNMYNTSPSVEILGLQPSSDALFALTHNCIYKTTDGGQHWKLTHRSSFGSSGSFTNRHLQIFSDTLLCYHRGTNSIGMVSDSGDSTIQLTYVPSYLYVQLQNEISSAIVIADSPNYFGKFTRYASKDFGETWQKVVINCSDAISSIIRIASAQSLLVNGDMYKLDTATLQYNFFANTNLPNPASYNDCQILHSNGKFIAVFAGANTIMLASSDGLNYLPATFTQLPIGSGFWNITEFFGSDSIWMVNNCNAPQRHIFSIDSGKTWQAQADTIFPMPFQPTSHLISCSAYHNGELYYGTSNASVWKKGPPAQLTSGTVFYDDNNNGIHDNLEQGASFVPINKKYNTALSNADGKFAINAPQASAVVSDYWLQQNNCIQQLLQQNQIALYRDKTICDLGLTLNPAIGSAYNLSCTINLHNYSGTAQNGMAYLQLPTNVVFDSASIKPTYISAQKIAWQNISIQPGVSTQQVIVYGHATNSADTITWAGTIATVRPDTNPSNNSDMVSISKAAMNSKLHIACTPKPNICLSDIAKGKSIEYTIRVNDIDIAGQSCSIQDTLSNLLDLGTLEIVALVPAGTITLNENGMLKVDFDFSNSTTKSGYIRYKIAAKQGLQEGQLIAKKVWLKTQSNDMLLSKHILRITEGNCNQQIAPDISLPSGQIALTQPSIYPNPTNGSFWIDQSKMPIQLYNRCKLVDVLGKQVLEIAIDSRRQLITVTEMPQGIYTLVLSGPDGVGNFVTKLLLNY